MTTLTASHVITSGLRGPSRPARPAGIRSHLAHRIAAMRAERVRRRLAEMPDYLLRDIGLTRAQLRSAKF
ncbi:DUF1127 domain-containing protein [Rubellimicrobium rubrum]|uniref:DUF1127 domain-containing protein n=1 Tax=Rubellimicrobium rubrum TaxID=2585369 RepID=A0A5C4N565_9RHOB|nr:DUF1127 domain-containing protein [Rubellimicrobium rubrum]TNC51478.1 DUF1127 domain-containing protein [Rubellimicrobium rubrum]